MTLRLLLIFPLAWIASCADSHSRDTEYDARALDDAAGTGDADFVCDPSAPHVLGGCPADAEEVCRQWGLGVAGPGVYGHATCAYPSSRCALGDDCVRLGGRWDVEECWCDRARGLACSDGEICVSDTPQGERRCIAACAWVRH